MNDMDRLTLELFTNKNQYKKYLSKIEPENYNEMRSFREKCLEHKCEILKQVELLLNETVIYDNQNQYIQDSFGIFAREIIKDIERKRQKEDDSGNDDEYDDDDDDDNDNDNEDMLFSPDKMVDSEPVEKYSFWGKERVIQQNSSSDFISHYPTNTSVRRRFVGRRNSILPKDGV
jgi:hypothetical protein